MPPASGHNGVLQIDVGLIRPNPRQPRKAFDPAAIEELGVSIKTHGLLQPVVVRREGDGYELILGERRWRAAVAAGIPQLPALVRDIDERQRLESALVENLQRQDLNPVEEARACQLLLDEFGLTHEELARRLGKSRPRISNLLRILTLEPSVLSQVAAGALSFGHAKALCGLSDAAAQRQLADAVLEEGLSVRQTEDRQIRLQAAGDADPATGRKSKKINELRTDPNVRDAEERLRRALGTGVAIRGRVKKGRIEIEFSGLDELQRLFEVLENAARVATPPPPAEVRHMPLPGSGPDSAENIG